MTVYKFLNIYVVATIYLLLKDVQEISGEEGDQTSYR